MDVVGKNTAKKKKKAFVDQRSCVACGCCVKVCPLGAIEVDRGITARVSLDKCVGCGKCARECPATVIEIREVEA
ncbi:MAG: 4Fe-4S dicluster-binding protein [Lachnospiraceae bacterium]